MLRFLTVGCLFLLFQTPCFAQKPACDLKLQSLLDHEKQKFLLLKKQYSDLQNLKEKNKLTLEALNRYVVSVKEVLDTLNIESEMRVLNGEKYLVIIPRNKKNLLNKLAFSLNNNYRGATLEFNPHTTIKDDALGFYFSSKHQLVLSELSEQVLFFLDSTVHHEVRHMQMSFKKLLNEKESVFNYEITKKEEFITEKNREENTYVDYLSMQELSTFPIEATQNLAIIKKSSVKDRDKILENISDAISQTEKLSDYAYQVISAFLSDMNLGGEAFKVKLGKDVFLDKEFDTLVLESREYTFTLPYFHEGKKQNRAEVYLKALNQVRELSYELWLTSIEAKEAFVVYKTSPTEENHSLLESKIKSMSAATRKWL